MYHDLPNPAKVYRGRFAPSPSGLLHLGSLLCALASFLDARANKGAWLIRIEDIDPPREQPGASSAILSTLAAHGMHWDEPPLFQSRCHARYRSRLDELSTAKLSYRCACTRARLKSLGTSYDGHCRNSPPAENVPAAIRLDVSRCCSQLAAEDAMLFGELEDFVVHRKDGLFAYQLAVVADDIAQDITHVVRGRDLAPMTSAQQLLFNVFGAEPPRYVHTPLVVDNLGNKLSKQNRAKAVADTQPVHNLLACCSLLGLIDGEVTETNLAISSLDDILAWAISQWQVNRLPKEDRMAPPEYQGKFPEPPENL
ncbi:glutamyl-Q tRNA(Asp) synthetase [Teredinibacter turnerae T7901]|uniref:Glutamyl-Q tRNA(Asp) synthetase n=1 Tax=Teredinibacter turnerae (strain ATCC 39867 / T7901) TaxID=377629 RepID=C5BN70_TERTT|nr:tRNA glutamyl-Q(34) synthetase GluQRS [Teredinibacter turnerae]ACR10870.1 glutamyl-Q tRNA(Asp) synthetase [Teredinibacter turnerae T7901]